MPLRLAGLATFWQQTGILLFVATLLPLFDLFLFVSARLYKLFLEGEEICLKDSVFKTGAGSAGVSRLLMTPPFFRIARV